MESSRQIEDIAAEWLARRDGEDWTQGDEAALEEWLRTSTANEVAFLRLEAAWEQAHRLQALGAGTPVGVVPSPGQWNVSPLFEQRQMTASAGDAEAAGGGMGAYPDDNTAQPRTGRGGRPRATARKRLTLAVSVLLALGVGMYLALFMHGDGYATAVGGMASIPLRDGSSITLNTQSKIRVALTQQARRIELEEGEAFFDVSRDPGRPFIVDAGDKRIVAVGTKFSVRRDEGDVEVIVTEGKVRLERPAGQLATAADANTVQETLLAAGAIARISKAAVLVENKTPHDAEEALSWRTGFLTFDTTRLEDAVTEFNRYTPHKIRIESPEVAELHISGKFRSNNAAAFIRMLHEGFGIQARESADTVLLRKR